MKFNSGRVTTQGNLGTIVQMGLAIKKMTEGGSENDNEAENEEDDEDHEKSIKDNDWSIFCTH